MLTNITQVKIKVILTSQSTSNSPLMDILKINAKYFLGQRLAGISFVGSVYDITIYNNLYSVYLKWSEIYGTNITYNIYRSNSENGPFELIDSGIENTYYYDYSIPNAQSLFYKVTATDLINGMPREGLGDIKQTTIFDEYGISTDIGSPAESTFAEFDTGNGIGQVNVANGNLYYQTVDFSNYSPGMNLEIIRTYNSKSSYCSLFGKGWDFNYNIFLFKEIDNQTGNEKAMILKSGDGTLYRFLKTESGYVSPVGSYLLLDFDTSSEQYFVKFKNGTVFWFNNELRIDSIKDRNNNCLNFYYDSYGMINNIYNNNGFRVRFYYYDYTNSYENGIFNPDSQLINRISYKDYNSGYEKVYNYEYNEMGKLISGYLWGDESGYNKILLGQYGYSANGVMTSIINQAGKTTTIGYTDGKATSMTNALNETLALSFNQGYTTSRFRNAETRYDYNDQGHEGIMLVNKITDARGAYTNYTFDENYNVETETYLNKVKSENNVAVTTAYDYDSNGNLLSVIKPHPSNENADRYTILYTDNDHPYTEFGQPTIQKVPIKLDNSNIVYAVTTYEYDGSGNLLKSVDTYGNETRYTYYGFGNIASKTIDINNIISTTQYPCDSVGRLTKTINPDNSETEQHYDNKGNIDWTEDTKNIRTYYEYDVLGWKIKTIYPGADAAITSDDIIEYTVYDKIGNVTWSEYADNISRHTYDALGRELTTTEAYGTPDLSTESTSYGNPNANGEYNVTVTDAEGVQTVTTYNALDQAIKEQSGDKWVEKQYDNAGNVIRTEDNTGLVTLTEYDILGRVTKTVSDPGDSTHKNLTCTYDYDLAGNCTLQTDEKGIVTESAYDNLGRVTHIKKTDPTSGEIVQTENQYDGVYSGKLKNVVIDGLGHKKEYIYNSTGTLASEIDKGDPNPDPGTQMVTSYTYDSNGNMLTKTAPDNSVTSYTHDSMNRLTRTEYAPDYYITYAYDEKGNQKNMIKTKGTETQTKEWIYDAKSRVSRIKLNGSSIAEYEYTDNDAISEMRYPEPGQNWRKINYTYDGDGNLTGIYDNTNALDSQKIREYLYTNGVLSSLKDYRKFDQANDDGDYSEQSFIYDTAGRLDTVAYTDVDMDNGQIISTTPRESYDLTLDEKGNIKSEDINTNYGTSSVNTFKEYEYDAFGRLKKEEVNNATTAEYTYDKAGNRLSMASGGNTLYYKYNEFNQLECTATDDDFEAADIVTSFGYDGRGNQTTQTQGTNVTTYEYDLADLLVDIKAGQNTVASYWYDGSGQRIKKQEGTNTVRYYYDGLDLLYSDDGTSQRLEENIIEDDGSLVASKRFTGDCAGKTFFYRQDIRGSVSNIVDKDGARVMGYTYDAYGNTTEIGDTNFINSKAYIAAVNDEVTGLIYMNARYYNPSTGRFLTQDGYRGNTVSAWNLYGYCDGDPVNRTDPTGYCYSVKCLAAEAIMRFFMPYLINILKANDNSRYLDFQKVDFAWYQLFAHYLVGKGKAFKVKSYEWAEYMKENYEVKDNVESIVKPFVLTLRDSRKTSLNIDFKGPFSLSANGYFTGYELMHSANSNDGKREGFQVKGKLTKSRRGSAYTIKSALTIKWLDVMDMHPEVYEADGYWDSIMHKIPLVKPKLYNFSIEFKDTSCINYNWSNINNYNTLGWLSLGW